MIFNDESLCRLHHLVSDALSDKRYAHTLGVEKMAQHLGSILIPHRVDELRVAALLHDITKELGHDLHIDLILNSDIEYTREDILTKPALHSFSAVPYVKRMFSEYATPDILSAISNHTLGNSGMTVFDEIIFLSDFIEPGRSYPSCISVRDYVLSNIRAEKPYEDNIHALHIATLNAISLTIEMLENRCENINSRTITTKEYIQNLINTPFK